MRGSGRFFGDSSLGDVSAWALVFSWLEIPCGENTYNDEVNQNNQGACRVQRTRSRRALHP